MVTGWEGPSADLTSKRQGEGLGGWSLLPGVTWTAPSGSYWGRKGTPRLLPPILFPCLNFTTVELLRTNSHAFDCPLAHESISVPWMMLLVPYPCLGIQRQCPKATTLSFLPKVVCFCTISKRFLMTRGTGQPECSHTAGQTSLNPTTKEPTGVKTGF